MNTEDIRYLCTTIGNLAGIPIRIYKDNKQRLLKALDNYGWRLGTGFLSTPFILDVLTNMDMTLSG